MTRAEAEDVENAITAIDRLSALLDMVALAVPATTNMAMVESAIDGAADFARTISACLSAATAR